MRHLSRKILSLIVPLGSLYMCGILHVSGEFLNKYKTADHIPPVMFYTQPNLILFA